MNKYIYFLQVVDKWCKEYNIQMTKLIAMRLSFFIASANKNIIHWFNFKAYPTGFCDLELLDIFMFTNWKKPLRLKHLDLLEKELVDESLIKIKEINPILPTYHPIDLCELQRKWYCYQNQREFYSNLPNPSNKDLEISSDEIMNTFDKYYTL